MTDKLDKKIMSVPQQVFSQLLKGLEAQNVSEEIILRLEKILLEDGQISVEAIKTALFSHENPSI